MSRPEHQAPPEIFYNDLEARKYTRNSRIQDIQFKLAERALELLLLPPDFPALVLDLGCGSGISGDVLNESGHEWVGIDISQAMLDVAVERDATGDLIQGDLGQLIRFRPGSFDGAISISALQWLCNADRHSHEPYQRLICFFKWLYISLDHGARAVFQFYPENVAQVEMVTSAALRVGFGGGVVVDFPNSAKAKKHFLVIWNSFSAKPQALPKGLFEDETKDLREHDSHVRVEQRQRTPFKGKNVRRTVKNREWILQKKKIQREHSKNVRPDTKYTGRKRKDKF